jgi:hypothetical protein
MAIATAAKQIIVDNMDIVVGGGQDSISMVQTPEMRVAMDKSLLAMHGNVYMPMLQTAETVAKRYNISREDQDAFSLLERAYEFHEQAKQRLELARLVALAEREQLRLGRSDVLRVTLREQAKFEAELAEVNARQEYWRAESELSAGDTSLGLNLPEFQLPVAPPKE